MYVFQLQFMTQKSLCSVLDADDKWEELAGMMKLTAEDVLTCRNARLSGESPSSVILRVWGSRGYTVEQLFLLLAKIRHYRAMKTLVEFVDSEHQNLLAKVNTELHSEIKEVPESGERHHQSDIPSVSSSKAGPADCPRRLSCSCGKMLPSLPQAQPAAIVIPGSCKVSDHNRLVHNHASACAVCGSSTAKENSGSSSSSASAVMNTLQNTLSVQYSELELATNGFDQTNMLGRGGYGVVYKGHWKHTTIAVKRIMSKQRSAEDGCQANDLEKERLRQSLMELKTLALYRHDNVLPLYGYSLDGPEPCLVYQYMAGGSLEDRLMCRKGTEPLTWSQRSHIAIGSARGLHFLHTICAQPLIHGDVKSANILLDAHLDAKLGDFGLSRTGQIEIAGAGSPLIASHIKGTLAYLPPEFIRSKHMSSKFDVYGFGVVLYEMVTGLRAYSENRSPENLADFILSNKAAANLIDVKAGPDPQNIFENFLQVGNMCVDRNPADRPCMSSVLSKLAG